MTRIAIPTRDEVPVASEPMLDTNNQQLGFTPNVFRIMSLSQCVFTGWVGLHGALAKTLDAKN